MYTASYCTMVFFNAGIFALTAQFLRRYAVSYEELILYGTSRIYNILLAAFNKNYVIPDGVVEATGMTILEEINGWMMFDDVA